MPMPHSVFLLLLTFSGICYGLKLNTSKVENFYWNFAWATWYGSPSGSGSDGGACGYRSAVGQRPFSSMTSAGGPSLFKSGYGCGSCYQVKCNPNSACSGKPVTIVITDECLGGVCNSDHFHFDMSGTAFGAMAVPGRADQLRKAGILPVLFTRVPCNYGKDTITFRIDGGSNPYYIAFVVEFEDGDGDLAAVSLQYHSNSPTSSSSWVPMQQSWGAVWKLNSGVPLTGPFSIQMRSSSMKMLVADRVIPAGWAPGQTYVSRVNYKD